MRRWTVNFLRINLFTGAREASLPQTGRVLDIRGRSVDIGGRAIEELSLILL
jgi:hypothetical protein